LRNYVEMLAGVWRPCPGAVASILDLNEQQQIAWQQKVTNMTL